MMSEHKNFPCQMVNIGGREFELLTDPTVDGVEMGYDAKEMALVRRQIMRLLGVDVDALDPADVKLTEPLQWRWRHGANEPCKCCEESERG